MSLVYVYPNNEQHPDIQNALSWIHSVQSQGMEETGRILLSRHIKETSEKPAKKGCGVQ